MGDGRLQPRHCLPLRTHRLAAVGGYSASGTADGRSGEETRQAWGATGPCMRWGRRRLWRSSRAEDPAAALRCPPVVLPYQGAGGRIRQGPGGPASQRPSSPLAPQRCPPGLLSRFAWGRPWHGGPLGRALAGHGSCCIPARRLSSCLAHGSAGWQNWRYCRAWAGLSMVLQFVLAVLQGLISLLGGTSHSVHPSSSISYGVQ